jgi:hypothetical protein
MLLHVGRATAGGFQIVEVWETREQFQHYDADVIQPAVAVLSGGQAPPGPLVVEEFEPRGLIVPAAHVAV